MRIISESPWPSEKSAAGAAWTDGSVCPTLPWLLSGANIVPLAQCFNNIVNRDHQPAERIEVDAKGYQGDATVPLLITPLTPRHFSMSSSERFSSDARLGIPQDFSTKMY
jgi:hypothetical protein